MKGLVNVIAWLVVIVLLFFEAWINFKWSGILLTLVIMIGIVLVVCRAQIMFFKGNAKYNTGDKEGAFKIYDKAYATGKLKPTHALYTAYLLLRDGQLDRSEKLIDEINRKYKNVLSNNDKLNIKINKTLIKWKRGDIKGAINDASQIYNSGVKATSLYGILGYWYILDNRYDDALKINEEGFEYNENDQIILDNLAQNYFLVGKTEKSEEMYKELIGKNPNFIEPYYNYGVVLKSKGDLKSAKEMFEKALTMEEKFLSTVTHDDVRKQMEDLS